MGYLPYPRLGRRAGEHCGGGPNALMLDSIEEVERFLLMVAR